MKTILSFGVVGAILLATAGSSLAQPLEPAPTLAAPAPTFGADLLPPPPSELGVPFVGESLVMESPVFTSPYVAQQPIVVPQTVTVAQPVMVAPPVLLPQSVVVQRPVMTIPPAVFPYVASYPRPGATVVYPVPAGAVIPGSVVIPGAAVIPGRAVIPTATVVAATPGTLWVAPGDVIRTKVYRRGEPVRNVLRAVTP